MTNLWHLKSESSLELSAIPNSYPWLRVMQHEGQVLKLLTLMDPVWWIGHIIKCMLVKLCQTLLLRDFEVEHLFLEHVHVE